METAASESTKVSAEKAAVEAAAQADEKAVMLDKALGEAASNAEAAAPSDEVAPSAAVALPAEVVPVAEAAQAEAPVAALASPPAAVAEKKEPEPDSDSSEASPRRLADRTTDSDGCLIWEVVLKKESLEDKFGFLQANGKQEFQKRSEGMRGEAAEPYQGPEVLLVRKIHEGGLLDRWNNRHPEAAVVPQDRITMVNEETTVEGMQRMIRSPRIVMKMMRYPEEFEVPLRKDGNRLGFRFEKPHGSADLRITEVVPEGALRIYNEAQIALGRWAFVVLPEMRLTGANNVTNNDENIGEYLKSSARDPEINEVTLHMRRAEQRLVNRQQMISRVQMIRALRGPASPSSKPTTPSAGLHSQGSGSPNTASRPPSSSDRPTSTGAGPLKLSVAGAGS